MTDKIIIVVLLVLLGISASFNYNAHKYRDAGKWHHQMEAREELLTILSRALWVEGPLVVTNDHFSISNVVIINRTKASGIAFNGNHASAVNIYSFVDDMRASVGFLIRNTNDVTSQ